LTKNNFVPACGETKRSRNLPYQFAIHINSSVCGLRELDLPKTRWASSGVSRSIIYNRSGEFLRFFQFVWIEAVQDGEEIGGAEGKADAVYVFLDELLGVKADDFAAHVEERAAGISRIDGRIGLDPGAGTSGGKFTHGATMPWVTPKSMASPGLPMARTDSPWRTVAASASAIDGNRKPGEVELILARAMSRSASTYTTLASSCAPLERIARKEDSPRARCALMAMTPVSVTKKPEPARSSALR
jgi:hypothetical protein